MKPRVSIVTPSYNQAAFLERTIESVLSQSYSSIEYIIIDGGSTDGSVEIIQRYARHLAYWVSERDAGQTDAINKGFRRASGELIGWLNSDDELTPHSVEKVVSGFAEPDVGIVYGDIERIDEDGNHLRTSRYDSFDLVEFVRTASYISQPGSLFRRSVVEAIGPLDQSLHFTMDLDLWLRAALVSRLHHVSDVVARFRVHTRAKSSERLDVAAENLLRVYAGFFARPDLPAEVREVEREAWGSIHLAAARAYYGADRVRSAVKQLRAAVTAYPTSIANREMRELVPRLLVSGLTGGRRSSLGRTLRRLYRSQR